MQKLTNDALKQGNFPDMLKSADVMPILKKDDPTKAKCYRSVSVLPGVSKTFERLMDKQWVFILTNFCPLTCVPSLLSLIEKLEKVLDNKEYGNTNGSFKSLWIMISSLLITCLWFFQGVIETNKELLN